MDLTEALRVFRILAPEFGAVDNGTVTAWMELTAPFVGKRRFLNLWAQALALLAAHRMKLANAGVAAEDDPLKEVGDIGAGNLMRVTSFSEGETSVGFNANMLQYRETNAELALTQYGVQYLGLRRRRIMSITSAGERNANR